MTLQPLFQCDSCGIIQNQSKCATHAATRDGCAIDVSLCPPCNDLIKTLVYMQYTQCWSATSQQQQQEERPSSPTKKHAKTIPAMLERIQRHRGYYTKLDTDARHKLGEIGRFDRRRNKEDNDYVRQCYFFLYSE